jgi:hypothetical protein
LRSAAIAPDGRVTMGKAFILWLLGVPLGLVILLYLFFFR